MEITNAILDDYTDYCHQRLTEEFDSYSADRYDPIYLYQRYKCRIIDSRKRKILEAKELIIPLEHKTAYENITSDIANGRALKLYQSRNLKNLDYDDDMMSHWGVQHFHLGDSLESDGYVSRTGDLLFIHFSQKQAHIIGIFNHGSWYDLDVIEIIHENWPQELTVFKSGSNSKQLTATEYKTIRKNHANTNVILKDGTEYLCPGIGVTSNGASIFAVFNSDKVIFMFNRSFELIQKNIELILSSDPAKRKSKSITIGMEIFHDDNAIMYKIKETGFKFKL